MNSIKDFFHSKASDRYLGLLAIVLILFSLLLNDNGADEGLTPFFKELNENVNSFELVTDHVYSAQIANKDTSQVGFISLGSANGFGGDLKVAVLQDSSGIVRNLVVVEDKETAAFLSRVTKEGLPEEIVGRSYFEVAFDVDEIDIVSGATYTSRALIDAAKRANRVFAHEVLAYNVEPEPTPTIVIDMPVIVLLLLFGMGFMATTKRFSKLKFLRWAVMIGGLIFIGFLYSQPFSISLVNKFVGGFFPAWQTNIYWYLLAAIIVLTTLFSNKNLYCNYVCPFGAAQECVSIISGTKRQKPKFLRRTFLWIQRLLALALVLVAIISGNPSEYSYEVFSVSFQLIGTTFQFALLGVVLIASLIIKRPWCGYLCPLRPVSDFLLMLRAWVKELVGYRI